MYIVLNRLFDRDNPGFLVGPFHDFDDAIAYGNALVGGDGNLDEVGLGDELIGIEEVRAPDLDKSKTVTVLSSNGTLYATPDGKVVEWSLEGADPDDPLHSVDRFDFEEWKTYHGTDDLPDEIDILDLGYWFNKMPYEPPCTDWRSQVSKMSPPPRLANLDPIEEQDRDEQLRKFTPTDMRTKKDTIDEARVCETQAQIRESRDIPHYVINTPDGYKITTAMPYFGEWYTTDGIRHG